MSAGDAASRVLIFDTTLRDGEQSAGASMALEEKLEIARALAVLGVDVIEAGFPVASPGDFASVRAIAEKVGNDTRGGTPPIICGLARAARGDLDKCWEAVRSAARPRIHTFISTSPIHREHKLRLGKSEVLERVRTMVAHARSLCADVEFSAEDAARTEPDFLAEAVAAAIENGATTINLPDTVGYATPSEVYAMIAGIRRDVPGADRVVLSVHCHDDLGLGAANTLAGLEAGARQAEVTINGIGERAGNTALEEIVMAIATRRDRLGLWTGIDTRAITRTSRLVSAHTGMVVAPNKAVVGANAFAHESGIHQHGVLEHASTYEIMRADSVGAAGSRIVLGKLSGRHALQSRMAELGMELEGEALDAAFARMKSLAERKKEVTDADLLALVSSERREEHGDVRLDALQVSAGTQGMATATARLRMPDGTMATQAAIGRGPVDAAFRAIDAIMDAPATLLEYSVHAVTEGIDALGEVSVRIRDATGALHAGYGADTDVIVASAKSYLSALNRMRTSRAEQSERRESAASKKERT